MVRVGFLSQMFDDRVAFFGLPAEPIVLAIAVVGAIVGLVWMRRLLTIEPDVHSFRATSSSAGRGRLVIALGMVVGAALLAAMSLGAIRPG